MKKIITLLLFLVIVPSTFAHYIWLESNHKGAINNKHIVKVRFGEYTNGKIEKTNGKYFKNVIDFKIWVIYPNGEKHVLKTTAKEDYYQAIFTPNTNGTYTIALDNKEMNVLDYTKYDYTIFKPQYHAKAKVVVGDKIDSITKTNSESIEIIDESNIEFSLDSEVKLRVLYKGKPLKDNELSIFMKNGWSKKIKTDKDGRVLFRLPFKTKYTIEATFEEKVKGDFKGKSYELIWHCATYCIML